MKFNMGCGVNKLEGFVNIDMYGDPDFEWNLEYTPWPWEDNCANEVVFNHSLEHMGQDPEIFRSIMKELYRISADGAVIRINVPHPRHDNFIDDPTHVRAITPALLCLFDKSYNKQWQEIGAANSLLAFYDNVDFVLEETMMILDDPHQTQLVNGLVSDAAMKLRIKNQNNVVSEIKMILRARK